MNESGKGCRLRRIDSLGDMIFNQGRVAMPFAFRLLTVGLLDLF